MIITVTAPAAHAAYTPNESLPVAFTLDAPAAPGGEFSVWCVTPDNGWFGPHLVPLNGGTDYAVECPLGSGKPLAAGYRVYVYHSAVAGSNSWNEYAASPGTFDLVAEAFRWLPVVTADDLEGQITETQIAKDAITTPKIAAGAVKAVHVEAGSITADRLDVGDVQAAVVTAAKINSLSIDAAAIKAGTLDVARIGAGSITANAINVASVQAAVVTAAKVNTLALSAGAITAGTLDVARIAACSITANEVNVSSLQAAVVTASKINTLALNASVIQAGTIDTARLNVGAIQAAVVTAAAINALTLNAVSITGGTITGAVIQTDANTAHERIVLSSASIDKLAFYTRAVSYGTLAPGYLQVGYSGMGGSDMLHLTLAGHAKASAPGDTPYIDLVTVYNTPSGGLNYNSIDVTAQHFSVNASSGLDDAIDLNGKVTCEETVTIASTLYCLAGARINGRIYPGANFPGTPSGWSSADGTWIQDNTTTGNRLKVTFNTSTYVLSVSNESGNYRYTSPVFTRVAI